MRLLAVTALFIALLVSVGCGNQMMRQPSYQPLATPRALPPAQSVPFRSASIDWDGQQMRSQAFGAAADGLVPGNRLVSEPVLPPPNLSDDASGQPADARVSKSVNALHNPLPSGGQTLIQGHTLFLNRCVQCHDPSGTGIGPVGGYLVPPPANLASAAVQKRSDGALFWTITMGEGKMPGFKLWTTPAERWALVSYTRSLHSARSLHGDTRSAPYPVYGVIGFENGATGSPHTVPGD